MTEMNLTNEFRVHPEYHSAVLRALQILGIRYEVTGPHNAIRVAVPAGVESTEHWQALRALRDATVRECKRQAGLPV